jgi:hypothetical protein
MADAFYRTNVSINPIEEPPTKKLKSDGGSDRAPRWSMCLTVWQRENDESVQTSSPTSLLKDDLGRLDIQV